MTVDKFFLGAYFSLDETKPWNYVFLQEIPPKKEAMEIIQETLMMTKQQQTTWTYKTLDQEINIIATNKKEMYKVELEDKIYTVFGKKFIAWTKNGTYSYLLREIDKMIFISKIDGTCTHSYN